MHRDLARASAIVALLFAAGCRPENGSTEATEQSILPAAPVATGCAAGGRFSGELFGDIEATIAWEDGGLTCEGMPRPDGEGARLRFAGTAEGGADVAVIVALPELSMGATAEETPATVTLINESSGRFYSNAEQENCWGDVRRQELIVDTEFRIEGIVYCVAPLAEVNGSGSVRFSELAFSGRLDWRSE